MKKIAVIIFILLTNAVASLLVYLSYLEDNKIVYTSLVVVSGANISISSPIEGKIEQINVTNFQKVQKGQVLFKLNSNALKQNIKEMVLNIEILKIKLAKNKKVQKSEEHKLIAIKQKLDAEKLEMKNIKRQVTLYRNLFDKNIVSENYYLNINSKYLVALQKIRSSVAEIHSVEAINEKAKQDYNIIQNTIALEKVKLEFKNSRA